MTQTRELPVMQSIEGFILTGGQSRRMGTDKALLTIGEQTFVEVIAGEMRAVTASINVVGGAPATKAGWRQISDVYKGWGALGGVHAALANCSLAWALVVACDFPFVTADLFSRMAEHCADFDAVSPVQQDSIPQPLCTLYRVKPCVDQAEQLIKSGERKPIALLQSVRTRWLSFDEIADLRGAAHFFDNINTPDDYAEITKKGIDLKDALMN